MSRRLIWILVIMSILLLIFSLCMICVSGKPVFDSSNIIGWIGFILGFLILMVLLYFLNIKVAIAYTLILLILLLCILAYNWNRLKSYFSNTENDSQTETETVKQLDENGNIIIDHPYDDLISLQWGTFNNVDLDLMIVSQSDNTTVNFSTPTYIANDSNSVWLDYDYKSQQNIAMKEVISILGMKNETFSIFVINYNGEKLKQDAILVISLSNGNTTTYTLPAESFNDETNGIHVCDIVMQTEEIIEVMSDFSDSYN